MFRKDLYGLEDSSMLRELEESDYAVDEGYFFMLDDLESEGITEVSESGEKSFMIEDLENDSSDDKNTDSDSDDDSGSKTSDFMEMFLDITAPVIEENKRERSYHMGM